MEYLRAKEITRNFNRGGIEITPIFASDWTFSRKSGNMYVTSEQNQVTYKVSNERDFIDKYILSGNYQVIDKKLFGGFYYTSVGFVRENMFFYAEDTIETKLKLIRLKKKELILGDTYLSENGSECIYMGQIEYSVDYVHRMIIMEANGTVEKTHKKMKVEKTTEPMVYNLRTLSLIRLDSIKLIKPIESAYSKDLIAYLPERYFYNYGSMRDRFVKIKTKLDFIKIEDY